MITYASYDFETWTQASCLGFRRDPVAPRPEVRDHNVAEEVHQGAMAQQLLTSLFVRVNNGLLCFADF